MRVRTGFGHGKPYAVAVAAIKAPHVHLVVRPASELLEHFRIVGESAVANTTALALICTSPPSASAYTPTTAPFSTTSPVMGVLQAKLHAEIFCSRLKKIEHVGHVRRPFFSCRQVPNGIAFPKDATEAHATPCPCIQSTTSPDVSTNFFTTGALHL